MAITNDEFCLTVMKELRDVAGENGDPMMNQPKTGLLDALMSPQNTNGRDIDRLYDTADGKSNKVILKYLKPDSYADTATDLTNICDDTGEETTWNYEDVAIDLTIQSTPKSMTEAQMRTLCEDGNDLRMKVIGTALAAMDKKVNRLLIPKFYAGVGGLLGGGGAQGTIYEMLFDGNMKEINPNGFFDMMQDLDDTGFSGMPLVVGGGNIKRFMDLKGIACCNAYGANPADMQDVAFYYDNDINGLISDSPSDTGNKAAFFAFVPGAAQIVDRPLYKGQFRKVTPDYTRDTITSPKSGLEYDFVLEYDHCAAIPIYTWKLIWRGGLYQLNQTLFKSADPRYKINGNFAFQATVGS